MPFETGTQLSLMVCGRREDEQFGSPERLQTNQTGAPLKMFWVIFLGVAKPICYASLLRLKERQERLMLLLTDGHLNKQRITKTMS